MTEQKTKTTMSAAQGQAAEDHESFYEAYVVAKIAIEMIRPQKKKRGPLKSARQ